MSKVNHHADVNPLTSDWCLVQNICLFSSPMLWGASRLLVPQLRHIGSRLSFSSTLSLTSRLSSVCVNGILELPWEVAWRLPRYIFFYMFAAYLPNIVIEFLHSVILLLSFLYTWLVLHTSPYWKRNLSGNFFPVKGFFFGSFFLIQTQDLRRGVVVLCLRQIRDLCFWAI